MAKKFILKEDFDSDFDSSNAITLVADPKNLENIQVVDLPSDENPEVQQEEIGVTKMLSDSIKDEWEAIDGYKSVISTLKSFGDKYLDIIKVLEEISTEEMVHVGQLEKCMQIVSPEAKEINKGQEEAEAQLNGEDGHEEKSEEVIEESCTKKVEEDFTYGGKGYQDYIAYWMDEALSEIDYLIEDGDSDDETVQLLRELSDEGVERLCNVVAKDITNSDYLWEQINERIVDSINSNIQDIVDEDKTSTELDIKDIENKEEENHNED